MRAYYPAQRLMARRTRIKTDGVTVFATANTSSEANGQKNKD